MFYNPNGKLVDKRDDFDFRIIEFPYICISIPESPAYGVYISQLIRYANSCSSYGDFKDRWRLLSKKLVGQGYTLKLKMYFHFFGGADTMIYYNITMLLFPLCVLT